MSWRKTQTYLKRTEQALQSQWAHIEKQSSLKYLQMSGDVRMAAQEHVRVLDDCQEADFLGFFVLGCVCGPG